MHLPPAAQWRLGRSRAHGVVLVLASAIYLLLFFALWGQVVSDAWWGLLAMAWVFLLHAGLRWWKSPAGVLRWTGREWHWLQGPALQVGTLRWVLDLQTMSVVHFGPSGSGAGCWLWLEHGAQSPSAWSALRRALLASAASAGQETLRAQASVASGKRFRPADYLIGSRTPQLETVGASSDASAGLNGFQDSILR